MAHIYNGVLLSHKRNETELFVVKWMDLESVIQSEVSQKGKTNTVCQCIYMGSLKKIKRYW